VVPPKPLPKATDAGPPAPRVGELRIECDVPDATVTVDGEARGTVAAVSAAGGLRLAPGTHRLQLVREGYRTYRIELNVGARGESLKVKLQKKVQAP